MNLVNEIRDLGMEPGTLELAGQAEASAMERALIKTAASEP